MCFINDPKYFKREIARSSTTGRRDVFTNAGSNMQGKWQAAFLGTIPL